MKNYIFTPKERQVLQEHQGKRNLKPSLYYVLINRIRNADQLEEDVKLFLKLRKKLKKEVEEKVG